MSYRTRFRRTSLIRSLVLVVLLAVVLAACSGDDADSPSPAATATPLPTVAPVSEWTEHTDAATGLTLQVPAELELQEQVVELLPTDDYPAVDQRSLGFIREDGLGVVGYVVAPNLAGLSVEEWVATYSGSPEEPAAITVAGEMGLRISVNVLNEPAAGVYFGHEGFMFFVSGNVYGSSEARLPPALTAEDFEYIVRELSFAQ